MSVSSSNSISLTEKGISSQKPVTVAVELKEKGHGIVFQVRNGDGAYENIPASVKYVVNTLRNVVLGIGSTRLCIVEHFLAAACLFGLDDLLVKVDGPEMPLGDGSAQMWLDLFKKAGWQQKPTTAHITLPEPVICQKGDRSLIALPDDTFSITYLMDWNHPAIGKCWQTWKNDMDINEIACARTFGPLKEHQLLGLVDQVVSLTDEGFSQPLHFKDEPVRHKLLDLMGDLALSGVNPMAWKAKFISIKAGHELDVALSSKLAKFISPS